MPGMLPAAKELHDHFNARRRVTCCRTLIKDLESGSAAHIAQCVAITGEVAADVIDLLGKES